VYNKCRDEYVNQSILFNIVSRDKKTGQMRYKPLDEHFKISHVEKLQLFTLGYITVEGDIITKNNNIKWATVKPNKKMAEVVLKVVKDAKDKQANKQDLDIVQPVGNDILRAVINNTNKKMKEKNSTNGEVPENKADKTREFLTNMKNEIVDVLTHQNELVGNLNQRLLTLEQNQQGIDNKLNFIVDALSAESTTDNKIVLENITLLRADIKKLDVFNKVSTFIETLKPE